MRLLLKTSLLLLATCDPSIRGGEPSAPKRDKPQPNHLVPVNPYPTDIHAEYIKRCHKLLLVHEFESSDFFQEHQWRTIIMICRPSFDAEECIALMGDDAHRAYKLVYTRPNYNINDSIREDIKGKKGAAIDVVKRIKSLDRDRAQRIYRLWERMLEGVHYPPGGSNADCPDDGRTFEFRYSWKGMYGETCAPPDGPAKLLTEVGFAMITYCKSQENDDERNLRFLDQSCNHLESILDADTKRGEVHP